LTKLIMDIHFPCPLDDNGSCLVCQCVLHVNGITDHRSSVSGPGNIPKILRRGTSADRGVFFVKKLIRAIRYRWEDGRTILTLPIATMAVL
jgi:hypothetical protein